MQEREVLSNWFELPETAFCSKVAHAIEGAVGAVCGAGGCICKESGIKKADAEEVDECSEKDMACS